jgi:glyoxylase-like metal-dependent hydrolase (beta-lactamase superfamily II)
LSVVPSELGTQPVGEATEVADGVWQLKVPVPIPLVFVSAYMIEGDDGWTLVDTGFDYPEGRQAWERGAASVGCDLRRDVARIIVTHYHPDHLGAARWLQALSGAPVMMLGEEITHAREIWTNRDLSGFIGHLTGNGMDRARAEKAASGMRSEMPLPGEMIPLREGEKLELGAITGRVLRAEGHADYQIMLHDEGRKLLLAADHVLLKITPNIGMWPDVKPHPLARYLRSLEELRGLGVDLVLPGHGPLFHDLDGRIDELISHHAERLEEMRRQIEDRPKTPFEVSRKVFRYGLSVYEQCFALAETLAHLDHLADEGRAERVDGEPSRILYRAKGGG